MKIHGWSALVLLVTTMVSAAAPRLVLSTPALVPESQIDLVLDFPVTEISELGKTVENRWLEIQPPLPGQLLWKAQNIAQFIPSQAPEIGITYSFAIPKNRKHLDKTVVPPGEFTTLVSEPFRVASAAIQNRGAEDFSLSTAEWLVVFNDSPSWADGPAFISFDAESGEHVDAHIERVSTERAGASATSYLSWEARFPNTIAPPVLPGAMMANAFMVTPVTPLPPGENWKLTVSEGLSNESEQATTVQASRYEIGTIEPFRVASMSATVSADQPRKLVVGFNQSLAKQLPENFLTDCITLVPRPANLAATISGREIYLTGDFAATNNYTLTFNPPFTSQAGLLMEAPFTKELIFEYLTAELTLPSNTEAQLASGSRNYRVQTVNLASLRVRIKKLAGVDLIRTYQAYRNYSGVGHDGKEITPQAPVTYDLITGETVLDREFPLGNLVDTAKEITLDWNELLPKELRHTALFIDITGSAHPKISDTRSRTAQSLLQLTDLGLAWKVTAQEAFIYAFSCDTGAPLGQVKIDIFGEGAAPLQSVVTDETGRVTLPRSAAGRHLRASLGDDTYLTAFDSTLNSVGMWHFPVRHPYSTPAETSRKAFLFTDRSLYRPGETVRLKGIVRSQRGNAIEAAAGSSAARIVILDPTEKEIHTTPVVISETGAFDFKYTLPVGKTGTHSIQLEFPAELAKAATMEGDWEAQEALTTNARFVLPLRVEEFRRNAFEVTQVIAAAAPGAAALNTELTAAYYQGQPVAAGKVKYFSRITTQNPYPERFRDYLFGNHRTDDWAYWYHYFGYSSDEQEIGTTPSSQVQGDIVLSAEGKASFSTQVPKAEFPTSREVVISSEVTDSNNQTLTATAKATVHPASIYVGVSRMDELVRAGEEVRINIVATDTAGEPYKAAVKVTATLTREVNNSVKSRTEAGATTTRNDITEETIITSELMLEPAASAGQGTTLTLTPKSNGKHILTLRGVDAEGRPFATVTYFNVYGTEEYPWLYEDGMRVKLVAEKKSYKPGEIARVLVLSPIEGTALVTVEREKVLRSFLVPLKADKPVIEIPLLESDAPNAYISVLIVKGAKESAREHKAPQLRLGYCELTVEDLQDKLAVTFTEDLTAHRPGDEVTVTGSITLADGKPATGAEVTLYAEDEGTLAVMGYDTPAPMAYFYEPRMLDVDCGTSFDTFIPEDPESQYFYNKGFFVGGGGDLSKLADLLRKNFDPCATWAPSLVTDASGKFSHTFKLPDTLTRYRLIAVAHQATTRFGQAESSLVVKKDLMLEPMALRFANQSDTFDTRVLVQNASEFAGTWEISFSTATPKTPACVVATGSARETITLAAGASTTVVFPARADYTGQAVVTWQATPTSLVNTTLTPVLKRSLSDAVEARFPVLYPMPLLRQSKLISLAEAGTKVNLRDSLDPKLLDGSGEIELGFCTSLLIEAAGSVDFLLSYPHGCVEQTTSSLIPWLAVEDLSPVIPRFAKLDPEKVAATIQAGVDRLLSMQLPDGSFTYWPGGKDAVPWATSYAGMGLILAAQKGANVPPSAIDLLKKNLIESLRGIATETSAYGLECHTRALMVLALAGSPQPAYRNLLVDRLANLNPSARSLLATATASEEPGNLANLTIAKSILNSKVPLSLTNDDWMAWSADAAYHLLAWVSVDPKGTEPTKALDRMLRDRNPYGQWNTTWVNGWSLLAMAKYAKNEASSEAPVSLALETTTGTETVSLTAGQPTASRIMNLTADMILNLTTDLPAYVRVNLAAKPKILPTQPVAKNGLSVDRIYERIQADGSATILTEPKVGDLIRVSLRVTLPQDRTRYLVIEDPLPAIFETVNSDFKSQSAAVGIRTSENDWAVSHSELRSDRASFFVDEVYHRGTCTLTYIARCTLAGQATAPPAKVESMYDPDFFALSASRVFSSR